MGPPVVTTSADVAKTKVLAEVGATVPFRDAIDARIIDTIINGTGSIIDDPSEVGGYLTLPLGVPPLDTDHDGMPDSFEVTHGFDINDASDGPLDADGDGYTNLEEYLNGIIGPLSDEDPPVAP